MQDAASEDGHTRTRRMAVSTALFAAATGLSRVAGLIREIVAAAVFGVAGAGINAFSVAFAVPNLVRALVADAALGASFVPIFNELLTHGQRERAWRVASSVFWISFIALSAVTAVFMIFTEQLISIFPMPEEQLDLAVGLARVMFPIVILLGLGGIQQAILNTFDEFFVPAVAPVAWNGVIIGALLASVPLTDDTETRLYVYAFGVLIGTAVQVALPLPWMRGLGGHIGMHLDLRDPYVRRVFVNMLPVTVGLGLINVNLLVAQWFALKISPDLAAAAIDKAFRVYMLPQGIFSVAVATVVFPALSRYAAAKDEDRFRATVASGVRQIAFLLVPAAVVCAVLAEPIVRLLYQRGEFTASQTPVVAEALAAFSLGLAFNGVMLLLNRSFYSRQQVWVPTALALASLALNIVLFALFSEDLGIWGIPLATSVSNIAGAIALYAYLRHEVGPLDGRATFSSVGRICIAGAVLAAVAYPLWRIADEVLGQSLPAQVASLALGLSAGSAAYLGVARALRVEEVAVLHSLLRR